MIRSLVSGTPEAHHLISPVAQKWIEEGKQDPEGFWGRAADQLPWFRKWDKVLGSRDLGDCITKPSGGQTPG